VLALEAQTRTAIGMLHLDLGFATARIGAVAAHSAAASVTVRAVHLLARVRMFLAILVQLGL
jgi:hypothetical protein